MLQTIKSFFQNIWTKVVDWAKLIWNESWTKLLAWTAGVPATLLSILDVVNLYVTDPMVKSYLDLIHAPQGVSIGIATLSLLIWLAHGRKND